MIIIFDVDETLLNIDIFHGWKKKELPEWDGSWLILDDIYYRIASRPGIEKFVQQLSDHRIMAFSVVDRQTTSEKLALVGLSQYFERIFGREDLIDGLKSVNAVAKDLQVHPSSIVAVDDLPDCWSDGYIIPIIEWEIGKKEVGLEEVQRKITEKIASKS